MNTIKICINTYEYLNIANKDVKRFIIKLEVMLFEEILIKKSIQFQNNLSSGKGITLVNCEIHYISYNVRHA